MEEVSSLSFTKKAIQSMNEALESIRFSENEPSIIFNTLVKHIRVVPFGDHLKRYIYDKCKMTKSPEDISIEEYQKIIISNFERNSTPKSFVETTAKMSALSKNWLTQQTVNRNVVFLLGFGLRMEPKDINDFLKKALREGGINAKSPFEVICWYCYKKNKNYAYFHNLWERYNSGFLNLDKERMPASRINAADSKKTADFRNTLDAVDNENDLLNYLMSISSGKKKYSVTAREHLLDIYEEVKNPMADILNYYEKDIEETIKFNKTNKENTKKTNITMYSANDVSPSDIERVIYAAVPIDTNGNMVPGKNSSLNNLFLGKRLSRQRLDLILSGNSEINRFDLITLNFLLFSTKEYDSPQERYEAFFENTNGLLADCYMAELYIANPYECFILMCLKSSDPLVAYSDVLDMSYETVNNFV